MIDFHAAHGVVLPLGTLRAEALAKAMKPSFLGKLVGESAPNLNLSSGGATPLCFAAAHGLIEDVRVMIKHGARPDKLDKKKRSPLHWAAHAVRYDRNAALACVRELAALSPQPVVDAVATGVIEAFKAGDDNRAGPILSELHRYASERVAGEIGELERHAAAANKSSPERAARRENLARADGAANNTIPETYFERVAEEFGGSAAPFERLSAAADGALDRLLIETLSEKEIDQTALKKLLESGANPNAKNAQGQTAMELAVSHGDAARNAVRMLSEHGASVQTISPEGESLLATAWHARAPKIAGILMRRGLDPNALDRSGETVLQMVSEFPAPYVSHELKASFVATLLKHGAVAEAIAAHPERSPVMLEIQTQARVPSSEPEVLNMLLAHRGLFDANGQQIHVVQAAADTREPKLVEAVLRHGAGISKADTALHVMASCYGGEKAVALLLDAGAPLEARNAHGETPLIVAAKNGRIDMLGDLLNRGANVDAKSFDGRTALVEAVARGAAMSARVLLEYCPGFSMDEKNALIEAVETGGLVACDFLRESGAPHPDIAYEDRSLLVLAAAKGQTDSVSVLLDLAATRNRDGSPWKAGCEIAALACAMDAGHYDTASALIDAGADPCQVYQEKEPSPFHSAAQKPSPDGLRFLLEKMPSEGSSAPDLSSALGVAAQANAADCVATLIEHGATQKPTRSVEGLEAFLAGEYPLTIAVVAGSREAAEAMLPHCDNKLIAKVLTHAFKTYWPSDGHPSLPSERSGLRVADLALSRLPDGEERERIERMAIGGMERMQMDRMEIERVEIDRVDTKPEEERRRLMPFVAAAQEQRSLAAIVKTASSAKSTSAEQGPGATVAPTLSSLGSVGSLEAAVVVSATAPPAPMRKGMRL